jgi:predicted RNase H-like nuclease
VVLHHQQSGRVRRRTEASLADLLACDEQPAVIGIDMVVGLPDRAERGGRECDRQARKLLGHPRGSSVFSPPVHAALRADSYDEAQNIQRASAEDAPGLSIQTYHLIPKLREVAACMTPGLQDRVREVHPELAWYAMNGETTVETSKHDAAGREVRVALLEDHGFPDAADAVDAYAGGDVGPDDVLDAHAVCWSAARIARGEAECLPSGETPRNDRGLRMEIWR